MRDGGVEKLRPGEMRIMCGNIPCGAQYHHPKEGSWNSAQQMQDKENFVVHHVFCGYLVKVLVYYSNVFVTLLLVNGPSQTLQGILDSELFLTKY